MSPLRRLSCLVRKASTADRRCGKRRAAWGLPPHLRIDIVRARRIEAGDPYFTHLRGRWLNALKRAHIDIPRPPYGAGEWVRAGGFLARPDSAM